MEEMMIHNDKKKKSNEDNSVQQNLIDNKAM